MSHFKDKTYFCVDGYSTYLCRKLGYNPFTESKGNHVRRCPRNRKCRGAHSPNEIKLKNFIKKFYSLNFKKLHLGKYDEAITNVLNNCKSNIFDLIFIRRLQKLDQMNFIEKLQLWVKLCYWSSKCKKERKKVPNFSIEDPSKNIVEDYMWALERLTHYCPHYVNFNKKIQNKEIITIRDSCLGGRNCKHGAHFKDQLINNLDLLTGESNDKMSLEEYNNIKNNLLLEIDNYNNKILKIESFENKNFHHTKLITKYKKTIFYKNKMIREIPRNLHLTELGLIPMSFYINQNQKTLEKDKKNFQNIMNLTNKKRRIVKKKKRII